MTTKKLFTVEQAAEALGVSAIRVRQLCAAGTIRAEKLGWAWVIPAAEIERARRRKTAPGPEPEVGRKRRRA